MLQAIEKLPIVEAAPVAARLSTYDGSVAFEFLIEPQETVHSSKANFSRLPVLQTRQPLVKWQYSESTLELPNVLFWSDGNNRDLSVPLTTLVGWTQPAPDQGVPKLLKFQWGNLVVPRCYLERFDYKVTQRRGAVPTEATGTMTLLYAPVPAEAKYEEVATKLTEREQGDLATKVKAELTTNAAKATKLAWDKKAPINVDAYGQVSLGDRQVGDVRDILPADQIPEGLKS